ncbi:unnamed protein product [Phyllotreta striolata]|uniref:Uncharacterized protein n=1 Tax=Phyllotreta striolata TaxID=444603 RepID=A0A9N9TGQ7_PHYSR|nr:unnamed protein product [Phyllotreta striolata]
MEKLTQFVSKSFENNNNPTLADHMSFEAKPPPASPRIKTEKDFASDDVKKPKNWLISDIEKNESPSIGIDLRLNPSRSFVGDKCTENSLPDPEPGVKKNCEVEKTTKWCKSTVKPVDSDKKESNSCSDKFCDKVGEKSDCNEDNNVPEENEHKI